MEPLAMEKNLMANNKELYFKQGKGRKIKRLNSANALKIIVYILI